MAEAGPPDGRPLETPAVPDLPQAGARPDPTAAPHLTHGFLFADLRDYTSYVEVHGDRAGAALLERYRSLVRGIVSATGGAEIRTEGDSFYVVFGSVSAAVRAGLAIVDAAARRAAEPDPIRVGVGVHAGETTETPEGFVGLAVNIAARLCAQAKAGELVVSETVRGITRTQIEVEFQPLGLRRLKGVPEPLACYHVAARGTTPAGAARPTRAAGPPRPRLVAASLAVAVILAVGAGILVLGGSRAAPAATPAASAIAAAATATPDAAGSRALAPSTSLAPAASANSGPFPDAVEAAILAALPSTLAQTCIRGGTPNDARLAGFTGVVGSRPSTSVEPGRSHGGVTCHASAGATRLYVMAPFNPPVRPGVGGPRAPADVYLGFLVSVHRLPFASCATDNGAHELWTGPSGGGTLACMNPYDGRPWIYFSFGKGQYLAFATRDDSNYAALYAWWEQVKIFLP
jgi:class 3 adenylate cyclase